MSETLTEADLEWLAGNFLSLDPSPSVQFAVKDIATHFKAAGRAEAAADMRDAKRYRKLRHRGLPLHRRWLRNEELDVVIDAGLDSPEAAAMFPKSEPNLESAHVYPKPLAAK